MGLSQLDLNLSEAWNRVGEQCRLDPEEALRRARRQYQTTLKSPPRAWCLAIRASDRRIGLHNALYEFPDWCDHVKDDEPPPPEHEFIRDGELWKDALARGVAHTLIINGSLIRELTKPVEIPWPGKPESEVARLLGRRVETIHYWIDRRNHRGAPVPASHGSLASGRPVRRNGRDWIADPDKCVLRLWGFDYCMNHSRNGPPVPIVYSTSPVDPNHHQGRPPDSVWGSLWQSLWKKMPAEFMQRIRRVPWWRTLRGKRALGGWVWVCPGLMNATGEFEPCGRTCRMLFAPMPIWTLAQAGIFDLALDLPEDCGLAGQWHPGLHAAPVGQGNRAFACHKCWKVSRLQLSDYNGWNRFVSYISGGLLYGHEVARPLEEVPMKRKRPFKRRKRRAPRRDQVVELLLQGLTYVAIGEALGITHSVVSKHVVAAYRQHDVHSRDELRAKLRRSIPSRQTRAASRALASS